MTNSESNTVSVLEVRLAPAYLALVETIPVGQRPSGIAVTRAGSFAGGEFVYVANREDDTVSVVDTTTDLVLATILVGNGPKGVAAGILPTVP